MKVLDYKGHVIKWTVEQPSGTAYWNTRGRVEFYERETFCTVNFTGAVNKFTSVEQSEESFLTTVKAWIDGRLLPKASCDQRVDRSSTQLFPPARHSDRFHGTYPPNFNEGTHLISRKGPTPFQVVLFDF